MCSYYQLQLLLGICPGEVLLDLLVVLCPIFCWKQWIYEILRKLNGSRGYLPEWGNSITKEHTWYALTDKWTLAQKSSCLCLPSAGIKGMCHHCPSKFIVFNSWVVLHCVNVPHFLYHSSVEGHLGSFQLLAIIINKAALHIVEHVFLLPVGTSSGYMPRRGIAGSSGSTYL